MSIQVEIAWEIALPDLDTMRTLFANMSEANEMNADWIETTAAIERLNRSPDPSDDPNSILRGMSSVNRDMLFRQWIHESSFLMHVLLLVDWIRDQINTEDRLYPISCIQYILENIAPAGRLLRSILMEEDWTITEKGLALEGLLEFEYRDELRNFVADHSEPEFLETFVRHTPPIHWGPLKNVLIEEDRKGPVTGQRIGTMASQRLEMEIEERDPAL